MADTDSLRTRSTGMTLPRVLGGLYRLERVVGRGGMGTVFAARHVHTDKMLAVKVLSPQLSNDATVVARFQREAMAASLVAHQNCVHVDDCGQDEDGTLFIAMEYIEGMSLSDALAEGGPMSSERVVHIGVQLLNALEAAHRAGVLHRDLKPQNVMLVNRRDVRDHVKVVDFGIAKITMPGSGSAAPLTVPGSVFGTPEYMSPEQARGEPLDARADIFSAAAVLWLLLLGRSPFRGPTLRDTLEQVLRHDPPSLCTEGRDVPPGLERLLARGLAKAREQRYPTAGAFADALAGWSATSAESPSANPTGAPAPALRDVPDETTDPVAATRGRRQSKGQSPSALNAVAAGDTHHDAHAPDTSHTLVLPEKPLQGRMTRARIAMVTSAGVLLGTVAVGGAATIVHLRQEPVDERGAAVSVHSASSSPRAAAAPAQSRPASMRGEIRPDSVDIVGRDKALKRASDAVSVDDWAQARRFFEEALQADARSAQALAGLATAAQRQKDWDTASRALERLIQFHPEQGKTYEPMLKATRALRDAAHAVR